MTNQPFSIPHLSDTISQTPLSSLSSPQVQPAYFSIKEAATYLNVNEKQIYALVHVPDFPVVKIGKHWRIDIAEFKQWLSKPKSLLN